MSTDTRDAKDSRNRSKLRVNVSAEVASKWTRRRDIPIAILAWITLVVVVLWGAGHVARSLLILTIAAFLAFALVPAVRFFERGLPRPLAILVVYLVVFTGIGMLLYLVISTAVQQIVELSKFAGNLLTPTGKEQLTPLENIVKSFGVPTAQILQVRQDIVTQLGNLATGVAGSTIPVLQSIFNVLLDIILVAVLSVYLLLDGGRAMRWLRDNLPLQRREQGNFLLNTLERVIGGYIRGQLALSALIGVLVGVGMAIFQVPYAVLLGVMAFILEFIPVLGTLISGFICVLLALTKGWLIAVLVLGYFIIVHVIEGDVVGPRIVGKAVGLHPVVSIVALIAGAELFGLWGALFASPIAGVLQALLVDFWEQWRQRNPDQFPEEDIAASVEATTKAVADTVAPIGGVIAAAHGMDTSGETEHSPGEKNSSPKEKAGSSLEDHKS
jgi:predicted PurR-regulated permease PerM